MKYIKQIVYICGILLLFLQCRSPEYLPLAKDVDTFTFGSHITLFDANNKDKNVEGEFIALENNNFYVLVNGKVDGEKHIETVSVSEIQDFKLKYAKSSNYTAATVANFVSVLSHGLFAGFSLPINIIVSIVVNNGGKNAFTYKKENISIDKIIMFSRFPQGLPEGVPLNAIK